jgi:hypothetical protein
MTVILVILSVLLENSGLLKSVPRQAEFEPLQQRTIRFSDVHGVDEVKEVSFAAYSKQGTRTLIILIDFLLILGTP